MNPLALSARESQAIYRALNVLKRHCLASDTLFSSSAAAKELAALYLGTEDREVFAAFWLNAQNRLIEAEKLFFGTLTQAAVYPREVVRAALRHNAAAVIFAHNHLSGSLAPSSADLHLTKTLADTLALVEVRVLDHLIVAAPGAASMAERGYWPLSTPAPNAQPPAPKPKRRKAKVAHE